MVCRAHHELLAERLRRRCESNRRGVRVDKLVAAVLESQADRIKDNTEWFSDDIAEGAPTLEQALRELVAGECTKKKHGFQYAYALEAVCAHLGKPLGAADFINWTVLEALEEALPNDEALRKLLSCENMTEAKKLAVPIPRPADFPGMGTLDAAQCKTCLAALQKLKIDPEKTYGELDGEELAESLDELKGWFSAAVKAKRGLMLFTY